MGLANPIGALALVAVAVLVALTLHQRRRRARRVSSLLLWRQLPTAPAERRRFRPDLLFFLQLAMLLALIGGYVRPYLASSTPPASGTALVVVLDCSASMQAREADGTRFELARDKVRAVIAAQAQGTRIMLVSAAERPHVVLRWSDDAARVASALDALAPLDTPTRLEPAVELALGAASRSNGATVLIATDLPPAPQVRRGPVRWIQVGGTADNVAITALTVDSPPFGDGRDRRVLALVQNFGATPRTTTITATIDDAPWTQRTLELPARGTEQVLFDGPRGSGVVRVRITPDDALPVDDEAVAWLPPPHPLDLVLVTDADAMATAFSSLVAALPDARLEVVNAAGWRERGGASTGQVALFDHVAPDGSGPALFVAPPPGDPICRGARRLDGAAAIDWDDTHPIVQGLDALEALEVGDVTQLGRPSWARVVIDAASQRATFPLLTAGERDGHRQACLGAALPVPLTSSDALPLLMVALGALRWASADTAETPLTVETGVPLLVTGEPSALLVDRVGVRRVALGDGRERLVLANLFDATESDIGRDGDGDWPALAPPRLIAATAAPHEFGWWLYAVGAALLAVEWAVGARR
ncbi:MAG TPA: VWA domain-containing protein [Candidatus Binatia bacterium]|jgi:hypothetical protein|nr:VWA domain-containing protein [Candidatus Binatia bacterium]